MGVLGNIALRLYLLICHGLEETDEPKRGTMSPLYARYPHPNAQTVADGRRTLPGSLVSSERLPVRIGDDELPEADIGAQAKSFSRRESGQSDIMLAFYMQSNLMQSDLGKRV